MGEFRSRVDFSEFERVVTLGHSRVFVSRNIRGHVTTRPPGRPWWLTAHLAGWACTFGSSGGTRAGGGGDKWQLRKHHGISRGGGPGGPDPPLFGPLCRLFNIGPKIRPNPGPPFLLADLTWTPPPSFENPGSAPGVSYHLGTCPKQFRWSLTWL